MKSHSLSLILSLALSSYALRIPFTQARRNILLPRSGGTKVSVSRPPPAVAGSKLLAASTSGEDGISLTTAHDLIYIANITVGGVEYPVQLDTGSSDLWIMGPSAPSPLPNANQTSTTYNLTYGIGWAFGHISQAPVEVDGISIPSQAFLDVSSAVNPALGYGASGILGLGFTKLSTIDDLVNQTGASTGRSVLFNAFLDNPKEPNFITFALQRSSDPTADVEGSFSIGEFDPAYAAVANSQAISTWPITAPDRWNVLLDSFIVNSQSVSVSSNVTGAPGGKAVILLDSGTSYTYCTPEAAQAIYGGVSGAKYDPTSGQWTVPCDAEIDMALQFAGQVYPVHPLDVVQQSLGDPSTCIGSFIPQSVAVGGGEFDWLVGDNFLRNVYSVYNFGDFDSSGNTGNPYIKLLSIIDPNNASVDFHSIRGGTPNTNVTYNASNSTSSSSSLGSSATLTVSDQLADTLNKIVAYIPAMLAILALNALVLIVLAVVGVCVLRRRRGSRGDRARKGKGRDALAAMPMNPTASADGAPVPTPHVYEPVSASGAEDAPFTPPSPSLHNFEGDTLRPHVGGSTRPQSTLSTMFQGKTRAPRVSTASDAVPHVYEPVSARGAEDPFAPPSPPFHTFDGDTLRPGVGGGRRPHSTLSTTSQGMPREYRVSTASDATAFTPPSPGYLTFDDKLGGRPKSVA